MGNIITEVVSQTKLTNPVVYTNLVKGRKNG